MKRVLVFDSGGGGLSVFDALIASGAALELDYAADNAWLPYGLKSDTELRARVPALLGALAEQWAPDLIVVACNTASTIALDAVRAVVTQPVVGVVPPIKPAAALSQTGVIGLLATPATVRRAYTDDLITQFAAGKNVLRFGSSALVAEAERRLRGEASAQDAIDEAINGLFGAPGGAEIDVGARAGTHFPLLAPDLARAAPRACQWLDSGAAIARRVAQLLSPETGAPRVRRAGFTDASGARAVFPAFAARGFSIVTQIGDGPRFDTAPLMDSASA